MFDEVKMEQQEERALLVGVDTGGEGDFEHAMEELGSLAEACGMRVAGRITQKVSGINKTYYVGSGKVGEIRDYAAECGAQVVVFDNSLSPVQIRNLDRELNLPIRDRTHLILDIFALRARTREAKLQVETARLQYMLPRLVGMRQSLGRQGGASGSMSNRGAGEKMLELDRRRIGRRISELKRELAQMERDRDTQRRRRLGSGIPQVALVGYTNAGKSTILNRMVERWGQGPEKRVLEKDMLFATLETSVRCVDAGDGRPFFLTDTVGFIDNLPHGLVKAFHSTLEEVLYADLLVQVIDFSDPMYRQHMEVTAQTLKELGAGEIPMLYAYNKADRRGGEGELPRVRDGRIYLSALREEGIGRLAELIREKVYEGSLDKTFLIPFDRGGAASYLMDNAAVLRKEYREDGLLLRVSCRREDAEKYKEYEAAAGEGGN